MRENKTKDLDTIKCIKDHNHKVLVKNIDIRERWKEYFDKLFNSNYVQDVGDVSILPEDLNCDFMRRIRLDLAMLDTKRRHEYEFDTIQKNN